MLLKKQNTNNKKPIDSLICGINISIKNKMIYINKCFVVYKNVSMLLSHMAPCNILKSLSLYLHGLLKRWGK